MELADNLRMFHTSMVSMGIRMVTYLGTQRLTKIEMEQKIASKLTKIRTGSPTPSSLATYQTSRLLLPITRQYMEHTLESQPQVLAQVLICITTMSIIMDQEVLPVPTTSTKIEMESMMPTRLLTKQDLIIFTTMGDISTPWKWTLHRIDQRMNLKQVALSLLLLTFKRFGNATRPAKIALVQA